MKYLTLSFLLLSMSTIGAGNFFGKAAVNSSDTLEAATAASENMTAVLFEDSLQSLYSAIGLQKYDLPFEAFRYGMIGYYSLEQDGKLKNPNLISIIDFTKPSTQKRFFTIDLNARRVKFHSYVSHGRNTGENFARAFSNKPHSNQSSLGFYLTAETYIGSKGYSLKLDGLDRGYNDNMRNRAVVMHDADYVSEHWIQRYGRLGRSQGCPALPKEISHKVIDTIKNGTLIFAYYNDKQFLGSSAHLNVEKVLNGDTGTAIAAK
jgi:hypothetical protein